MGGPASQPGPRGGRKYSREVAASKGSSGLDRRSTCVPPPFHVTSGQLVVGQGVVVHAKIPSLACTTTPCPTAGWPPVTWKGSGAHVPLSVQAA
ncbi:unnamed protein product [Spirodela intermedia]|uniref:Uncharacterized protein n=1 Tax=Spirodela intermedia TaxID=51605 RepID=A0A7I8K7W4_SPIIN|nr:unnamed protein product [Spirodela intermedia]